MLISFQHTHGFRQKKCSLKHADGKESEAGSKVLTNSFKNAL